MTTGGSSVNPGIDCRIMYRMITGICVRNNCHRRHRPPITKVRTIGISVRQCTRANLHAAKRTARASFDYNLHSIIPSVTLRSTSRSRVLGPGGSPTIPVNSAPFIAPLGSVSAHQWHSCTFTPKVPQGKTRWSSWGDNSRH